MPMLPTFEVTQAQADRMLAAYGSVDGYKRWLREQIVEHVLAVERQAAEVEFRAAQEDKRKRTRVELGVDDPAPTG